MKRILILIVALVMTIPALAQITVRDRMTQISEQYGVNFVYDPSLPVNTVYNGIDSKKKSLDQSLEQLFRGTGISWERRKTFVVLKAKKASAELPAISESLSYKADIQLDTIKAATIIGNIDRNTKFTQTGLTKIDGAEFNRGFAIFSTPDIIKTLQILPGVASGTELMSGLFVHGGTGGDNLFLLDGSPVYNPSHLIGLFSAFNPDVVDGVDFYKSGFPARYGGRLSSVVDVATRDGDMNNYHGSFSLGLIDGRFQIEGPISKGRTSFLFGLRRTWMEAVSFPALAIVNSQRKDKDRLHGYYSFWDLNCGVTHMLGNGDRLRLRLFNGMDHLNLGADSEVKAFDGTVAHMGDNSYDANLNWGSTSASFTWEHSTNPVLISKLGLYYSYNLSNINYGSRTWGYEEVDHYLCIKESDKSGIHGVKLAADFDWTPSTSHHIRYGISWEHHAYLPERSIKQWHETLTESKELSNKKSGTYYSGDDASAYIEDEITLLPCLRANLGARAALFIVKGKTYFLPEPRAAVRYDLSSAVALKASYTWMSQFEHRLQTTYVDLPSCLWLPATAIIRPMQSQQAAAGVYATLTHGIHLDVEGFWKTLDHIYEYSGPSAIYPPVDRWESAFTEGEGRAYGAEVTFGWENWDTNVDVAYTLSWSERYFPEFSDRWYPDRNDNRHKFNITATHKFNAGFELYAGWVYHSGNRMSVGTQGRYQTTVEMNDGEDVHLYTIVYTTPNNIKLPDYHRLDIGMNFIKQRPNGRIRTWNISLYNTYSRFNALYADVVNDNGIYKGRSYGFVPIIPTFSYNLKF